MRGRSSHGSPYWMKKTSIRVNMVREAADKKASNIQARSLVARNMENMSDADQRQEKKRAAEKKLNNARKLRGIYFTDPTDAEFQEFIENDRKKLEGPMPASMPCTIRRSKYGETCSCSGTHKTKYACIAAPEKSTRKRLGKTLHKDHDTLQKKESIQ